MNLDPQLAGDACNSPITQAVVRQMAVVQALRKIAGPDFTAARDTYVYNRSGAEAAASAEFEAMTDEELSDLVGDLPHRAAMFVERAFHDIDKAVGLLALPIELVAQIDGHMVALYAAAMLVAEVREHSQQLDDEDIAA